jgi:hypothetical protein
MDFHCDGKVNYSEFLAATISTINFNKEEKLWSAFNYFDTTDSGYITLDSVMDALKNSGVIIDEEGLKKAFSELQKKEKKINFNEFKAIALGKEMVEEEYELIKEEEQEEKKKLNLKLNSNEENDNIEQNNSTKKLEIIFEREEKKESQDILFEKINFSNLNKDNNENKENKENNANDNKNEEEYNKNEDNNKNENSNLNSNGNSNANINNSNHKNNSKSNSKSNNNKSSKSNNKSSKSNNKSSKSNNKSSKSNKSNMEVLIEEQSIDDNNDKFTEVNEVNEVQN